MDKILVTGGAGYIGSHMVKLLTQQGFESITLDNLSKGHRDAVLSSTFVEGDTGDKDLLRELFDAHDFKAVMHFAGFIVVSESVEQPERYFENNVEHARALVDRTAAANIPFIFSSSAAVYGIPEYNPIDEAHPTKPINPYGETKLQLEEILAEQEGLVWGSLRYFNAAGADPEGALGPRHDPVTHLIPRVLKAAKGEIDAVYIYGDDYDTPDGTCIRDYIHVVDLCDAHLKLLEYLLQGGEERVFNLGTGEGYSVKEVIDCCEKITGETLNRKVEQPRLGDAPVLIANGSKARDLLGWKPHMSDLETVLSHAWAWESKL